MTRLFKGPTSSLRRPYLRPSKVALPALEGTAFEARKRHLRRFGE